jgi:hypothetical protein
MHPGTTCFTSSVTIGLPNYGWQIYPNDTVPAFIDFMKFYSAKLFRQLRARSLLELPAAEVFEPSRTVSSFLVGTPPLATLPDTYAPMRQWAERFNIPPLVEDEEDRTFALPKPKAPLVGLISRTSRRRIMNEPQMVQAVKKDVRVVRLTLEALPYHEQVSSRFPVSCVVLLPSSLSPSLCLSPLVRFFYKTS